jgi:hypothetical protein
MWLVIRAVMLEKVAHGAVAKDFYTESSSAQVSASI